MTADVLTDRPDAPDPVNDERIVRELGQAWEVLPPRDRLLLTLAYYKDLAPVQIAGILRISLSAVYTQKSRALAKLWETLRKSEIS